MTNNAPQSNDTAISALVAEPTSRSEIVSAYAALFSSVTTLFCCALPAFLVLLGFGLTSVLTFFTAIPGWETFGIYEMWYFALSGGLLVIGFYFAYFRQPSQGQTCDSPQSGSDSACSTARRWNQRILWIALFLFGLALLANMWGIGWMMDHGYFNH